MEWNGGMERWNGTVEWTGGMEWWNTRLPERACAIVQSLPPRACHFNTEWKERLGESVLIFSDTTPVMFTGGSGTVDNPIVLSDSPPREKCGVICEPDTPVRWLGCNTCCFPVNTVSMYL